MSQYPSEARAPDPRVRPCEAVDAVHVWTGPDFVAFTLLMDASGQWEVEVPTPVGRIRFEVQISEDGTVEARYHGRRIPVPDMQTSPEGDGLRVGWTQQLTFPFPVGITVDALVIGDLLTGTATAGGFPPVQLEGHRVG